MLPLVSVVITTKNHAGVIEDCLLSIKNQSYPSGSIEIIVVDNFSTDDTYKKAKRYSPFVFRKGPERTAQRNFGMLKKASGKYVLYLDADMRLSKDIVKQSVTIMEKKRSIVGIYIPEIVIGYSFWVNIRRFERSFYDGTAIDCVRFIRRQSFVNIHGFDTNLDGTEDWDLDKRLRAIGETAIITESFYHNEGNFSLKTYLAKKGYYAKNFITYIKKWGRNDQDVKKQFSLWYRLFGVFVEKGKWKKIVKNPHLFITLLFLRLLVAVKVFFVMHIYDKNFRSR